MERNQSKDSHSAISINKDCTTRESVHNKSNLENNRLTVNVPSLNASDLKINSIGSKVKMMKAASLFDSQRDMDIDGGAAPPNVSIRHYTHNVLNKIKLNNLQLFFGKNDDVDLFLGGYIQTTYSTLGAEKISYRGSSGYTRIQSDE